MSENYIVINGKRAELTKEQLKQLGIVVKKETPFDRQRKRKPFYYIINKGTVEYGEELEDYQCDALYDAANYCTDKAIMEQRALHETLNRLLWRYSMEHEGDKIDWTHTNQAKWEILYNHRGKYFEFCNWQTSQAVGTVFFATKQIAELAVKEIIEPFMEAHPEFKW